MAEALRALLPPLAYAYLSAVGATSRVRWEGLEHLRGLQGKGFIYAFWHQRQAFFTWTHRGSKLAPTVLVSRSRDGELIARAMRLSGIASVRGSSSRGASSAARELLEVLASGRPVGITPDGPKGPAREVKPGALYLALKSGCPILPIANALSRTLTIARAWDRFQVPLPFSRACVVHGPPLSVRPQDDLAAKAVELKRVLDETTARADRLVGA